MPFLDPATGTVSNAAYAVDAHTVTAEESSVFSDLSNVVTKGVPLTGLAIVNSFANTGIDVANWFGAGVDRLSIEDQVGDGTLLDYYKEHTTGIEASALLIGSLIPGLGALKGANAAVKATWLAKSGYSTEVMSQATGILAPFKAKIVANALNEISDVGSVYNALSRDKFKLIGLGVADQALQGLLFEAATIATMKASPLLDKDGLAEITHNLFWGAVAGGVLGGAIEGYLVHRTFAKAGEAASNLASKYENLTRLGGKDQMYEPGDRAALLADALLKLPEPGVAETLGRRTLASATDRAVTDLKILIKQITPEGQEYVSVEFVDALMKARSAGLMSSDDMLEKLGRLGNVSLVKDVAETPTSDVFFFVNKYTKKNDNVPGFNDLMTNSPRDGHADYSLAYRMAPGATEVKIARFDEVSFPNSRGAGLVPSEFPKYTTVSEAWAAGHDVFVDRNLHVHINPNAENILGRAARAGESRALSPKEEIAFRATGNLKEGAPTLKGAPTYLNLLTGEQAAPRQFNPLTGKASPGIARVVGDLGVPELVGRGVVKVGDREFSHTLEHGFITPASSDVEASSRFVWAELRGTKRADMVDSTDIPMMEKLYRDAMADKDWAATTERWKNYKLSILQGGEDWVPRNLEELASTIRGAKDDLLQESLQGLDEIAVKSSLAEIAAKANVPESYVLNGFQASEFSDFAVPIGNHMKTNWVQLEYNMGNVMHMQDGMIAQGMIDLQYRVQLQQDVAHVAATQFFKTEISNMTINRDALSATTTGAGPSLLGAANAAYNTLKQEMERVGRSLGFWFQAADERMGALLSPVFSGIRNASPEVGQELNVFTSIQRRTGQTFSFLPPDIAKRMGLSENTVVVTDTLLRNKSGAIIDWDHTATPKGFLPYSATSWEKGNRAITPQLVDGLHIAYELAPEHAAFQRAHVALNNEHSIAHNRFNAAQGVRTNERPLDVLYAPPIDVAKYPHFAVVKELEGKGGADGGMAVVTAKTARDLENKVAGFKDNYQIIFKNDIKKYHELLGDYQYNRNFAEGRVNSDMRRQGVLNDVFPETNVEATLRDYTDFHARKTRVTARDGVELNNAQFFAEMTARGEQFAGAEGSKRGPTGNFFGRSADNPFDTYLRTALGLSDKESYPLWVNAQEKVGQFFNSGFQTARDALFGVKQAKLSYEQASQMTKDMGLGNPYEAAYDSLKAYTDTANNLAAPNYMRQWLTTAHTIVASTAIRLDAWQALINTVSTPILMLAEAQSLIKANSALLTTVLPDGSNRTVPSITKLMMEGIGEYFSGSETSKAVTALLKANGSIRKDATEYLSLVNDLHAPLRSEATEAFLSRMKKVEELGFKFTGNQASEEFSRWIPGYMAFKIFQEAGVAGQQLSDNVATFVNRVQGNYIASQRPIAFQGPIGSAIGMFQTYQINLMQQMLRFVENKEAKSLAIMAGAQVTLFGFNGLPGFHTLNAQLVGNAAGNPAHKDFFSVVPDAAGDHLGKWLMYGSLSNIFGSGLYGRGDINPRQATIIPVNPLDFPAISGGIKLVGSLLDMTENLVNKGSIPTSLLIAAEHNGLSRPLAGLAQLAQGFVTTSKGQLVSTTRPPMGDDTLGWNDLISFANFSRLLGARPLDEAVAMDYKYRRTLYDAKDATRRAALGEAVKTHLYGASRDEEGEARLSPEMVSTFASMYAQTGGRQELFGRQIHSWMRDTNASVANEIFTKLQNPKNQQAQRVMGGQPLPDYANQGSTEAKDTRPAAARRAPDGKSYMPDPSRSGSYLRVDD